MNIFQKTKSLLKALFGPKTEFKEYCSRLNQCKECPWRIEKGSKSYCRECGCPETSLWPFSELKTKCAYKNAECPRKRWSKSDYMFTD